MNLLINHVLLQFNLLVDHFVVIVVVVVVVVVMCVKTSTVWYSFSTKMPFSTA